MKLLATLTLALGVTAWALPARAVDYLTYHGDTLRSGWNNQETALTPTSVQSAKFRRLFVTRLDGVTFGQPLVAANESTPGGTHDLVIVATMANSLYALDAHTGRVVWHRRVTVHGRSAVPAGFTGCAIAKTYGIAGTPVIDRAKDAVYVAGVVLEGPANAKHMHYYLHMVSLASGAELVKPVLIQGSTNGPSGTEPFIGDVQTQRPGLLEANGNIYVTFGSICDYNANLYHGWIFAYNASSLAPTGIYNSTPALSSGTYYGGIWMNGDAPAVDPTDGSLIFVVGNGTFDNSTSFGDSVVRLSPNLASVIDYFTPYTVDSDNAYDADFGAGGIMLLPDNPSSSLHMAVAQGKDGILTLMNREHLGGYTAGGPDNVLAELNLGGVWSSPAYFQDGSGNEHVYTTGGPLYDVAVKRSPAGMSVAQTTPQQFPQDNGNGATPTVSSNGGDPSSAIVWIVQTAPASSGELLTLYAYAASNLSAPIYHASLGPWQWANSYRVPTIANGVVYVPGQGHLLAFGLK
jgi:hypothetical protein